MQDGPIKSQSRRGVRLPGTLGNHCNCDSFVKRISKENTGTNCSPLLALNTPANYQLSAVHKAPWRAADVAVSRIDSFTLYAHKLRKNVIRDSAIASPIGAPRLFPIHADKNRPADSIPLANPSPLMPLATYLRIYSNFLFCPLGGSLCKSRGARTTPARNFHERDIEKRPRSNIFSKFRIRSRPFFGRDVSRLGSFVPEPIGSAFGKVANRCRGDLISDRGLEISKR